MHRQPMQLSESGVDCDHGVFSASVITTLAAACVLGCVQSLGLRLLRQSNEETIARVQLGQNQADCYRNVSNERTLLNVLR